MFTGSPDKKEARLWANVKNDGELWDVTHYAVQGTRKTMEDSSAIIKQYGGQKSRLFVGVFDGHCGNRCAKYASEILPKTILESENLESNPCAAIRDAFFTVDKMWLEKAKSEAAEGEKPHEDGSTACVCIILNKILYVANCGDSKAIMSHGGELKELTTDQKPDDPLEKERIEKAGGTVVNGRIGGNLSVARSFGDYPFKKPDFHCVSVEPAIESFKLTSDIDYILIACDGLFEEMTVEEVHEFVSKRLQQEMPTQDICKKLVEESLDLGSQDNNSVILVKFEKPFQKLLKQTEKLEDKNIKKSNFGKKKIALNKSGGIPKDDVITHPNQETHAVSLKIPIEDNSEKKKKGLFTRNKKSLSTNDETRIVRDKDGKDQSSSPSLEPDDHRTNQLIPPILHRKRTTLEDPAKEDKNDKKDKRKLNQSQGETSAKVVKA